jgi:glycosyltransferase involved in cell wall biosynthesis
MVFHSLGPYHRARLAAARGRMPGRLAAIELAGREAKNAWTGADGAGAADATLFPDAPLESLPPARVAAALTAELDRRRPAAVIANGYARPFDRAAAEWARRNRAVSLTFFDSTAADRPRVWWKEWLKRRFVSAHFDGAFCAGERSVRYAADLGIPESRTVRFYDVVDNAHFAAGAEAARSGPAAVRARWNLPSRYFLYVGRLAPEKNLLTLLKAFAEHRRSAGSAAPDLVIAGTGPKEAELRAAGARLASERVRWLGFVGYDDLPAVYGLADALVLPSLSEPWGLVVNESLAAGTPVIVSQKCGCVPEMVREPANGFVFDPGDPSALAGVLDRFAAEACLTERMRPAACRAVADHTPERWAECLELLLDKVGPTAAPHR